MNTVASWLNQPFNLLDSNRSRLRLIIFCGVFGCLFLNVFQPFNLNLWFSHVNTPLFIVFTFFSTAGMAALALSQFAVRKIFNVRLTTRLNFLAWSLVEFFFITVAIHAVDVALLDVPFSDLNEFLLNLKHTCLIVVLPYFLGILLLNLQEQLQTVEELTIKVNKAARLDDQVNVNDEKGKVIMTLPIRHIVYFKSEDNYILLFYKQEQALKKELIRTNLKKLEQELNQPNMVRIHRSYMINSQNLLSAVKTSRGYKVKMDDDPQHHLPVSSTYQATFEDKIVQTK